MKQKVEYQAAQICQLMVANKALFRKLSHKLEDKDSQESTTNPDVIDMIKQITSKINGEELSNIQKVLLSAIIASTMSKTCDPSGEPTAQALLFANLVEQELINFKAKVEGKNYQLCYHLFILKLCFNIYLRCLAAYRNLQSSSLFTMLSERTLQR